MAALKANKEIKDNNDGNQYIQNHDIASKIDD